MKPISRTSGRSAVAASAHRAGECLTNERDCLIHDFRLWRKRFTDRKMTGQNGVFSLPDGQGGDFDVDELGVTELSLASTPLDATTAVGARLLSYGSVTFASGGGSTMFEAIFASSNTDTKYAGEAGKADWQAGQALDAKGFGRITEEFDAGFYAIVYRGAETGEVAISYRGADEGFFLSDDFYYGFGVGIGDPTAAQGIEAIKFCQAARALRQPVVLAGQSLGGGLAGFVANDDARLGLERAA